MGYVKEKPRLLAGNGVLSLLHPRWAVGQVTWPINWVSLIFLANAQPVSVQVIG